MPLVICYFCLCVPLCGRTTASLLPMSRHCNGQESVCFMFEIKCHLHFDGCLLRESVLIVPYNSMLSFSLGLRPDSPTHTLVHLHTGSRTMWCCRASSQGHCGPSPGAAVLSDKSMPDLLSELNRSIVISTMRMSAWMSCGFPHSLGLGYLVWLLWRHWQPYMCTCTCVFIHVYMLKLQLTIIFVINPN